MKKFFRFLEPVEILPSQSVSSILSTSSPTDESTVPIVADADPSAKLTLSSPCCVSSRSVGFPRSMEFYNTQVGAWIAQHGGTAHYSTVRRPTACAMVERVNRSVRKIMRVARHTYPNASVPTLIRRAIYEYRNRPHSALGDRRPNEVVSDPKLDQDLDDQADAESEIHPDSRRDSDDADVRRRVLLYEESDKLDFRWKPGTILGKRGDATVVRPDGKGRHTVVSNQQWIQGIPRTESPYQTPRENAESEVSVVSVAKEITRSDNSSIEEEVPLNVRPKRKAGKPKRYM